MKNKPIPNFHNLPKILQRNNINPPRKNSIQRRARGLQTSLDVQNSPFLGQIKSQPLSSRHPTFAKLQGSEMYSLRFDSTLDNPPSLGIVAHPAS